MFAKHYMSVSNSKRCTGAVVTLTICMLETTHAIWSHVAFLFIFIIFKTTMSVSNDLDPGQVRHFVGPDLGPNCLPRLSADHTCKLRSNIAVRHKVNILHIKTPPQGIMILTNLNLIMRNPVLLNSD